MTTFSEREARPFKSIASEWGKVVSGFEKDLKAPIFLKNGNVAALASQYDALQQKFISEVKRTGAVDHDFDDLVKQMDQRVAAKNVLGKKLDGLVEKTSALLERSPQGILFAFAIWEKWLKDVQDGHKEEKAVFDQWTKLNANIETVISAAIAKAKNDQGSDGANPEHTNDQLNAVETQMQDTVAAYSKTATSINRQDIAGAMRKFLAILANA